jgi:hypothetical protein
MNELNDIWEQMLENAIVKAEVSGKSDVAEYLKLKATNDAIRSQSAKSLLETMLEMAHFLIGKGINIKIENENPHRFEMNKANVVGSLLRFQHGLRCLTIEIGWTRTPSDGFMRGNALAFGKISHFGMSKKNAELHLAKINETPQWFLVNDETRETLLLEHLREHFKHFLG